MCTFRGSTLLFAIHGVTARPTGHGIGGQLQTAVARCNTPIHVIWQAGGTLGSHISTYPLWAGGGGIHPDAHQLVRSQEATTRA